MIKRIRNFLLEDEFKIIILKNKINICNYESIEYVDNDQIIIKNINELLLIKGKNLVITKLLNDEILITGMIKNIEMR